MAGRDKIKVSEYDTKGKLVAKYDNILQILTKYYSGTKYPLWNRHKNVHILRNGNIITKGRLGGHYAMIEAKKLKDPYYINDRGITKVPVSMYNINGQKLATFASISLASKFTGIDVSSVYSNTRRNNKKMINSTGLYFTREEKFD